MPPPPINTPSTTSAFTPTLRNGRPPSRCVHWRVPLYVQAQVPLAMLYTEGYLAFAFRRTLSRLQEMQLRRFG